LSKKYCQGKRVKENVSRKNSQFVRGFISCTCMQHHMSAETKVVCGKYSLQMVS
jgi:hypothetical protein